jgi:bile acid:Na+ symporter, BASS family
MPNGSAMQLNVFGTVIAVVVITIIPVSIGMLIHKLAPAFSQRMERPVRILSAVFLALIILAAILKERAHILEFFQQAGPVALLLNLLTLGIGFYTSRLFRLPQDQSRTIAIESGIQNGTLGITIAATLIGNSAMTIPSVIYSLIMFGTVLVLVFRSNAKV